MSLTSYKEFTINDKVRVKKDIIYDFLMSNYLYKNSENDLVIEYVIHNSNLLTISQIEHNPYALAQIYFQFRECDGSLFYNQIMKHLPIIRVIKSENC